MNFNLRKYILIILGLLCVLFGGIGIVLPLIPTTPFLLLAVYFFSRSSQRLRLWLIHHKVFGKYIYNYTVHKAIPMKAKVSAIVMIWLTLSFSMYIANRGIVIIILSTIGILVTIHLISLKTLRE